MGHVSCLPSIRESGGGVLLEAMASARPVISIAFGGPLETVDEQVGQLIPLNGYQSVVTGIIETLRDVVKNPETWRKRGENAAEKRSRSLTGRKK